MWTPYDNGVRSRWSTSLGPTLMRTDLISLQNAWTSTIFLLQNNYKETRASNIESSHSPKSPKSGLKTSYKMSKSYKAFKRTLASYITKNFNAFFQCLPMENYIVYIAQKSITITYSLLYYFSNTTLWWTCPSTRAQKGET